MQANILAAIAWLVRDCEASDSLFFSFSGHGCQPPHPSGGSWDEGILPCDFQQVCFNKDRHCAVMHKTDMPLQVQSFMHVLRHTITPQAWTVKCSHTELMPLSATDAACGCTLRTTP